MSHGRNIPKLPTSKKSTPKTEKFVPLELNDLNIQLGIQIEQNNNQNGHDNTGILKYASTSSDSSSSDREEDEIFNLELAFNLLDAETKAEEKGPQSLEDEIPGLKPVKKNIITPLNFLWHPEKKVEDDPMVFRRNPSINTEKWPEPAPSMATNPNLPNKKPSQFDISPPSGFSKLFSPSPPKLPIIHQDTENTPEHSPKPKYYLTTPQSRR